MRRLFIGVDGGQSSTTTLIGDETGRVLGVGQGGPCNHVGAAEGRAKLTRSVRESVGKACDQAGLDFSLVQFEAACFGMSGGPDDKEDLLAGILSARRLIVTHDGMIALAGATAGDPGIVMIAGTGSLAFGRNAQGKAARAGGWGYVFGDEGGGFDIVRQALRASLRFEEGWGPPTALHQSLIQATGATSASDVQHRFYTLDYPRPRIASLSRLVDQAADDGDRIAADILHAAAQHLAGFSAAVRRQLWERGEPVRIAYVGGVFRSPRVLERFRALVELADGVRCHAPEFGPAAGALFEAYRAASLHPKLSEVPEFKS